MINFFTLLQKIASSSPFILIVVLLSVAVKLGLSAPIVKQWKDQTSKKLFLWFLLAIIISSLVIDFSWIAWLVFDLSLQSGKPPIFPFFVRLAWGFAALQYQAIGHLLEGFTSKQYKPSIYLKIYSLFSVALFVFWVQQAVFKFGIPRTSFEGQMQTMVCLYELLLLPVMINVLFKTYKKNYPKILKRQIRIMIQTVLLPFVFVDFLQAAPWAFWSHLTKGFQPINIPGVYSITTLLLTLAIYVSARKMLKLRFLNLRQHVEATQKFNFIDDFKVLLEQLGKVTKVQELTHITRSFFSKALSIPYNRTHLFMRPPYRRQSFTFESIEDNFVDSSVESFISLGDVKGNALKELQKKKIFIADEIAFDKFYNETETNSIISNFLDVIDAGVFLPIFNEQTIVAYILIEKSARSRNQEFYTDVERDEMIVFASHLGHLIYLLQNKNLDAQLIKEKHLIETLYHKDQKVEHCKESIRSFLRFPIDKKFGIIFYKQRRFFFANRAAQEFIPVNVNTQEGHPLSKKLKKLVRDVTAYNTQQSITARDPKGDNIVVTGLPKSEHNNILIIVHYPEIADILQSEVDLLADHGMWDYLLFLRTTKAGQIINKLIPGNGSILLQFKIDFLKMALGKKTILLDAAEDDIPSLVESIHSISGRKKFYSLQLTSDMTAQEHVDTAIRLFGLNPIFGKTKSPAMLDQAHNDGTIFINNIHHLDLDTQNHLAHYLKSGFFKVFKSDQKRVSSARIICFSNADLPTLIHEGKFSEELHEQIKEAKLTSPSLLTLPHEDFVDLAEQYTEQAIDTQTFKNLLLLTSKDKKQLLEQRALSFYELRTKLQQILSKKSKHNKIAAETNFGLSQTISDPDLAHAARLGKQALRNFRLMSMLWDKFKNQNKIATFLGVNRSSVSRRCKEFNLI